MKKRPNKALHNYNTLVVDKETVVDKWGLPYDDNVDEGVKILEDTIVDTNRWSIIHELIVDIKGKTYDCSYSVAATEYQDEQPWRDDDHIEFVEVQPVEKVITIWQRVPKSE